MVNRSSAARADGAIHAAEKPHAAKTIIATKRRIDVFIRKILVLNYAGTKHLAPAPTTCQQSIPSDRIPSAKSPFS
jgi:hypothetical protein